jgi:HK97 family phage portal protein
MLNKLLKRQFQGSVVYTNTGYVDSLGRVGRFFEGNWAGVYVDQDTMLGVPAIWRGITLISDAIGAMPLHAYRGDTLVKPTPNILLRPNPPCIRMETIAAMASALLIHGNYIAVLGEPGANGLPESFYPVEPNRVNVSRDNGRMIYMIDGRQYDQSQILHIKNFSMPGALVGVGILGAQKQALGKLIAINEYASRYFDGGVSPSAILKSANPDLTQEEADALKAAWMSMYSSRNRAPAVLNSSTEFQVLSDNAQEAQLIEAQQQALVEASNILGLPAYYLGAPNSSRTYSNVEQENLQLIRWSIQPIAQRIEEALSDLLVRGQVAKFNFDSLLRTDTLSRYQAHQIAISNGFLTVDEVREMEKREGLDDPENALKDEISDDTDLDDVDDESDSEQIA